MAAKRAKSPTRKSRKKKPQIFCYTRDLTEALGVTRRTVYTYVQESMLPAPILLSDGLTGVLCRWPKNALEHAHFINEQKAIGYNIPEIKAMIAARYGIQDKIAGKKALEPQAVASNGKSSGEEPPST